MKSILGLLAAVSMTSAIGGAVPSLLVTNYQNNHLDLSPLKSPDDKLVSESDGGIIKYHHLYIRPGTFEDIVHLNSSHSNDGFTEELFNKMIKEFTNFRDDTGGLRLTESFVKSWDEIYDGYKNTSKINRVKINFKEVYSSWDLTTTFQSFEIDSNIYENPYYDNLNRAFNGDLSRWKDNNIGISQNDSWSSIWERLQEKYSALRTVQDKDKIELESIEPYSYFTQGYFIKLRVRQDATNLSVGTIPNGFVLNTQENFDKINEIIENDVDVQQWKTHLADFNKRVERQIKEDIPSFTPAEKRTWKDMNAEIMKGYIRDWSIIQRLIFDELKIDELKASIDKIQEDIANLRQEIKNIQQKIDDILNGKGNAGCDKIDIISKVSKYIPEVGGIISGIFGVMGTLCKIQAA